MNITEDPVIVEQTYNTTINKVWNAITELDQMKKWFFSNIEAFEPVVGFTTQFNIQAEDRNFLHQWKIIEVIPHNKIVYNWKYEGIVGDSNVTFELINLGSQTKLQLTTEVIESFDDAIPEFNRESCVDGWNYFICKNLQNYLAAKS